LRTFFFLEIAKISSPEMKKKTTTKTKKKTKKQKTKNPRDRWCALESFV